MRASAQLELPVESLENHAALAARLVRSKPVFQIFFRWLSRMASSTEPPQSPSPAVKNSIDKLLNPLRHESDRTTQKETEYTSLWLASICEYVAQRSHLSGCSFYVRSLAAALLPTYRTLATGRLHEGLTQTRHRLGETLAVVGMSETLQLQALLGSKVGIQSSPHKVVADQLKIDSSNLNYLICQVIHGYNQAKDDFDSAAANQLAQFRPGKLPASHQVPDWADPQLLWGLSNELVSNRAELILPRSWIDTPVPWRRLSEHWVELEQLLTSLPKAAEANEQSKSRLSKSSNETTASTRNSQEVPKTSSNPIDAEARTMSAFDQAVAIVEAVESGWDRLGSFDAIDRALTEESTKPAASSTSKTNTKQPELTSAPSTLAASSNQATSKREQVIPKVIIGEISNHNDPAFANVVRRQVGICRQEDRSICLSMIMVIAQDQNEHQALSAPHDNGLNRWQQKLVNWICDHPELKQPSAFLTRDGQLILAVMDTERNAMTRVLRQGLVEVLSGKKDQSDDLSRVNIPASFHVGISSTSSPSASFEFTELIASAHRCQSAAQRMGSASIKSIEVY
jgi:hypothetical protein